MNTKDTWTGASLRISSARTLKILIASESTDSQKLFKAFFGLFISMELAWLFSSGHIRNICVKLNFFSLEDIISWWWYIGCIHGKGQPGSWTSLFVFSWYVYRASLIRWCEYWILPLWERLKFGITLIQQFVLNFSWARIWKCLNVWLSVYHLKTLRQAGENGPIWLKFCTLDPWVT